MYAAFLTPTLPWPADTGGTMRTYYLLRSLAQQHTVDLFSIHYGQPPDPGPLTTLCNRVTPIQLGEQYGRRRQILDLLNPRPRSVSYFTTAATKLAMHTYLSQGHSSTGYDLIICDEVMMTPYIETLRDVPTLLLRSKIDHLHYAEMATERAWGVEKILDLLESRRLKRYERQALSCYDGAVVCSPDDAAITATQAKSLPVEVIPSGADIDYFIPTRNPDTAPTILLLGTMHYYPNIDAVLHFFETMYPTLRTTFPDLEILIVGHRPPDELRALAEYPGVTVTGSVEDVRPYIARSWVMVVPLRLGGGTRLKIIEALSAELPVVSTRIGAQGLQVEEGRHLLLADEPQEIIAAVERILTTPTLAQQLATEGRALAETIYSWQILGEHFAKICEKMGNRSVPPPVE